MCPLFQEKCASKNGNARMPFPDLTTLGPGSEILFFLKIFLKIPKNENEKTNTLKAHMRKQHRPQRR